MENSSNLSQRQLIYIFERQMIWSLTKTMLKHWSDYNNLLKNYNVVLDNFSYREEAIYECVRVCPQMR